MNFYLKYHRILFACHKIVYTIKARAHRKQSVEAVSDLRPSQSGSLVLMSNIASSRSNSTLSPAIPYEKQNRCLVHHSRECSLLCAVNSVGVETCRIWRGNILLPSDIVSTLYKIVTLLYRWWLRIFWSVLV